MNANPNNMPVAKKQTFSVALSTEQYQTLISSTITDPKKRSRFVASITSAVAVNPALQECTNKSIIAGALLGEALNLSPSPQLGQYYLVPFDNKVKVTNPDGSEGYKTEKNAQFILSYIGYIQLALRSGYYRDINAIEIKEGEYLGKDPFSGNPRFAFISDDEERESRKTIGYMASFEYLNGFKKSIYWSKEKVLNHADTYSKAFSKDAIESQYPNKRRVSFADYEAGNYPKTDEWKYSSFWYKSFDTMALKTMIRQLLKHWGMLSTEMQLAFERDDMLGDVEDGKIAFEAPNEEEVVIPSETEETATEGEKTATETITETPEEVNFDEL